MNKVVDIYLPLDSREDANRAVWPVAARQLKELVKVIAKCGWKAHVLNPARPVPGGAEGLKGIRQAPGGLAPNAEPTPDFKPATPPDAQAEAELKLTAAALTFAAFARLSSPTAISMAFGRDGR